MSQPSTTNTLGIAVRAVTAFIVLPPDTNCWKSNILEAVLFAGKLANDIRAIYTVQSLRIITNPFGEYLDTTTAESALNGMEIIKSLLKDIEMEQIDLLQGTRIRFSIGAADANTLSLVPALVRSGGDLANCCINIPIDDNNVVDADLIYHSAQVVKELGETTERGEGNFNFTINFNGPVLCPYFPAGFNTKEQGKSFVIGLEYPNLLVNILQNIANTNTSHKEHSSPTSIVSNASTRSQDFKNATHLMKTGIEQHLSVIVKKCRRAEGLKDATFRFAGVDSSPAPSKSISSMCKVIELLGVPYFGASGTTEACAMLTRVFKSVDQSSTNPVPLVGFSGLMFAALEDQGLADAAAKGCYDIRNLLTYSAVCGIGLDTVPIPFDTSIEDIARLTADVGTMAYRLSKPLTVRLFPVPGKSAGEMTSFESDDLCNCTVFKVP